MTALLLVVIVVGVVCADDHLDLLAEAHSTPRVDRIVYREHTTRRKGGSVAP
jgi:hypothetical protein